MNKTFYQDDIGNFNKLVKKIGKGGATVFIGNSIGNILLFIFQVVLARGLGSAAYGLYALGINTTKVVQTFASLGTPQGIIRFGAAYLEEGDKAKVKGAILESLLISIVGSVIIAVLLFIFSNTIALNFFHKPELANVLRILALGVPFFVLVILLSSIAQAFQHMKYYVGISRIFHPISNLIIVMVIFLLGYRLYGALVGIIISATFSTFFGFYLLKKLFPELVLKLKPMINFKKYLNFCVPIAFISLFHFLAFRTDRIILGIFRPAQEVGIYNAAGNIARLLIFVHFSLTSVFMPIIVNEYNKGNQNYVKKLYNVVKRWSSYVALALFLVLAFYSRLIISLFGQEFVPGWIALIILSFSYTIWVICGPTGAFLQMTGKQNVEFFNGILFLIYNIIFNLLLIPRFGLLGAAIATMLAILFLNLTQLKQIHYFFKFHPFDIKFVKFIVISFICIMTGIILNMFLTGKIKLLLFIMVIALYLFYIYINRMNEDNLILIAVKKKFNWRKNT